MRSLRVLSLAVLACSTASSMPSSAQSRHIEDNSFLIEEAYNQERGVVQHISSWQRSLGSASWLFTFTQEWPLGTQRHQLSYTIPFQRLESPSRRTGLGDAAVNYRYQLLPARGRVALAPRLAVVLPTGREALGLGAGTVGVQLSVPSQCAVTIFARESLERGADCTPTDDELQSRRGYDLARAPQFQRDVRSRVG